MPSAAPAWISHHAHSACAPSPPSAGARMAAVSCARGSTLVYTASTPPSSPVRTRRAFSAPTWARPRSVSPVHVSWPDRICAACACDSPWRITNTRVEVMGPSCRTAPDPACDYRPDVVPPDSPGGEPLAVGDGGRLAARGRADLPEDVRHVHARGLRADEELVGDLTVGPALGDEAQHLGL